MFWSALWSRPETLSPLAKYTIANGLFYGGVGAALLLTPTELLAVAFMQDLDLMAGGLCHLLGMAIMFVGWFYVMGGRTGATSFALSTVVDRLLVPFILAPFVLTGSVPVIPVAAFGILDPLLALGALAIWWRTKAAGSTPST